MQTLVDLGRVLFSAYFLYNGINHFANVKSLAAYAGSKKVPAPHAVVIATGLMLLAGGASFLFGFFVAWGSLVLALFLVPAAIVMHDFWSQGDPGARANEMAHFLKNVALAAAALAFAGSWGL